MVPEAHVTEQPIPRIGGRLRAFEYYIVLVGVQGRLEGMVETAKTNRESKEEALRRLLQYIRGERAILMAGEGIHERP